MNENIPAVESKMVNSVKAKALLVRRPCVVAFDVSRALAIAKTKYAKQKTRNLSRCIFFSEQAPLFAKLSRR